MALRCVLFLRCGFQKGSEITVAVGRGGDCNREHFDAVYENLPVQQPSPRRPDSQRAKAPARDRRHSGSSRLGRHRGSGHDILSKPGCGCRWKGCEVFKGAAVLPAITGLRPFACHEQMRKIMDLVGHFDHGHETRINPRISSLRPRIALTCSKTLRSSALSRKSPTVSS